MSNLLTICNCDNIRNKQSCLYSSSYIWHNSYSLFCWCIGKKCMFIPRLPIVLQSAATKWSIFNFLNTAKALWRPMLVSYEQTVLHVWNKKRPLWWKTSFHTTSPYLHYFPFLFLTFSFLLTSPCSKALFKKSSWWAQLSHTQQASLIELLQMFYLPNKQLNRQSARCAVCCGYWG